jgi:hypothetical protein
MLRLRGRRSGSARVAALPAAAPKREILLPVDPPPPAGSSPFPGGQPPVRRCASRSASPSGRTLRRCSSGAMPSCESCVEWQRRRRRPFVLASAVPTPDLRPVGLELMGHPPFLIRPAGRRAPTPRPASPSGRCSTRRDRRCGVGCSPRTSRRRSRRRRPRCSAARPDSGWHRRRRAGRHRAVAHRPRPGLRGGGGHPARPPGPGLGAAATWAATLAQPDLPAVLTASEGGIGVSRRMGYLPVVRWTMWFRS